MGRHNIDYQKYSDRTEFLEFLKKSNELSILITIFKAIS
ncbi:MAG: hypothetical protein JWM09_1297 [Francisellaceae bacterium]|nr:hypothetical protein [Francisellaceae bacterium]